MGMYSVFTVLFLLSIFMVVNHGIHCSTWNAAHTTQCGVTLEGQPNRVIGSFWFSSSCILFIWKPKPDTYFHSLRLVTAWRHITNLSREGRKGEEREETSGCNSFWSPGCFAFTQIGCRDLCRNAYSSCFYIWELHPNHSWVPSPIIHPVAI